MHSDGVPVKGPMSRPRAAYRRRGQPAFAEEHLEGWFNRAHSKSSH